MRRTWQPGRRDLIDYPFAQRLIDEELAKRGKRSELQLIEYNLSDDGFVGFLHNLARDPDVPDRIRREDFEDMAMVAHLILEDRKQQLLKDEDRKLGSNSGRRGGPFKVWSDLDAQANDHDDNADQETTHRNPFERKQED